MAAASLSDRNRRKPRLPCASISGAFHAIVWLLSYTFLAFQVGGGFGPGFPSAFDPDQPSDSPQSFSIGDVNAPSLDANQQR
jgi:hypothetical protein